jgi:hypothetical protein
MGYQKTKKFMLLPRSVEGLKEISSKKTYRQKALKNVQNPKNSKFA